jgi:NTE family protein
VADDINRKLTELNSRREFDSVSHELVQKGDEYGVKIKTKGKNWGPHFLRFGLSLSSGFDGAGGYRLQVGHRRPWLTEGGLNGAMMQSSAMLKLRSELRQPLHEREGMYLAPFAEFSDSSLNYYREDVRLAEYSLRTERAGIELAIPLGVRSTLGEARIGLNFNSYRVSPKLVAF